MHRAVAATNLADETYGEGVYALTRLLKGWVLSHFLGHACVREISGEKMSTLKSLQYSLAKQLTHTKYQNSAIQWWQQIRWRVVCVGGNDREESRHQVQEVEGSYPLCRQMNVC